jgi:N-acetylglutamate synthase-like GNAT family acetyltransferase
MMIREATMADAKWILHHRLGMFKAMGEPEEFIEETSLLTKEYFLVEEIDEIIGGCGLSTFRLPPTAHQKAGVYSYLSNVYIEPDHQGKGLGRTLLKHVIEVCKEEQIGMIILHSSAQGLALFNSEGFRSPNSLMHLLTLEHPRG